MMIMFSVFLLFCGLVALAIIDWRTFRLPDILTLPLIVIGLIFSYLQNDLVSALIGACLGYGGFVALELAYKHLRGVDGLGRGDAKLLAAGGAWCGWYGLPFIIFIGSMSGLFHIFALYLRDRKKPKTDSIPQAIPFGPYLSFGIFLTWVSIYIVS